MHKLFAKDGLIVVYVADQSGSRPEKWVRFVAGNGFVPQNRSKHDGFVLANFNHDVFVVAVLKNEPNTWIQVFVTLALFHPG